jgi:hypothetical protein
VADDAGSAAGVVEAGVEAVVLEPVAEGAGVEDVGVEVAAGEEVAVGDELEGAGDVWVVCEPEPEPEPEPDPEPEWVEPPPSGSMYC